MAYIKLEVGKETSPTTNGLLSFKLYPTYDETKLNILLHLSRRRLNRKMKEKLLIYFDNEETKE